MYGGKLRFNGPLSTSHWLHVHVHTFAYERAQRLSNDDNDDNRNEFPGVCVVPAIAFIQRYVGKART